MAVTAEGGLFSWGRGMWGQLGNGSPDHTCRPGRVQALMEHRVLQVEGGRGGMWGQVRRWPRGL